VQSLKRTFYRCFLPTFSSFGWGVSEEKIKMWKVNGRQTTDAKWWQKLTLPLARWAKNTDKDLDFQCHMLGFFCVQYFEVRGDCFVDIAGIVDYHCLNFLFITEYYSYDKHIQNRLISKTDIKVLHLTLVQGFKTISSV
jgi:hypothetical protein